MQNFHPFDVAALVLYLAGITVLGIWMARRVKNTGDFFMPRRFGKAMMVTFAFGTGTASDQAVSVSAGTFQTGLSGIWWQWVWLPATPFYWLIAPIMRRLRAITTADVYALRYDRSVAVLFALVGIANLSVKIGLLLKGAGELIDASTGGLVPFTWAVTIVTVLFVVYGTAGGLAAAIVTDFIQGILTVVFSFMLLPVVLQAVGGMEGIRQTITDPDKLLLVAPGKIGVFFVVMFAIQTLVGIVGQPFIMGVCAAGRTESDGRFGFMVGNLVKRICTIAWCLTAMAAMAWYIRQGADLEKINPDHVYGNVAYAFLPTMLPGLLGVFLASLMASVMSSCDAMMVSSSALFTQNLYKPCVTGKSQRHYLFVGRVASVAVVAGGIVFALLVPDVITALKIWFMIAPIVGISFWLGLLWRRATPAGAWASSLVVLGVWWVCMQEFFIRFVEKLPIADSWGLIYEKTVTAGGVENQVSAIYDPWLIAFYMSAALLAGIIVSLLTKPLPKARLDLFYNLTRTPICQGEQVDEPCTLPRGVEPAQRRMLLTAFGLEIPVPSRTSVLGFLAGWLAVAALVGGFIALVRW
jgi:Na+/proline symporter